MKSLADKFGMIDVVFWSGEFRKYYSTITSSEALIIHGRIQESFGAFSMIAERIEKMGVW